MIYSGYMIRIAQTHDLLGLHNLVQQLGYDLDLSIFENTVLSYLTDAERAVYVDEVDGVIAGFIALDIMQTFHHHQKQMRIISLVIDQSKRGLGIGGKLLKVAENLAREKDCWVVELTSSSRREKEGTHDFYINHGYLKNGEQAYFRKLLTPNRHQP